MLEKKDKKNEPVKEKTQEPKREEGKAKKEKKQRKTLSENSAVHVAMPVVMLALCVFFGICIYTEISVGIFGDFIAHVFFGLFGVAAYFIPPFCLLAALFWRAEVKRHSLLRKSIFGFLCLLLIAILFYTFGVPEESKKTVSEFWDMGREKVGGGLFGNLVGLPIYLLIDKVGTVILAVAFLLLFSIFFFEINFKQLGRALARSMARLAKTWKESRERAKIKKAEAKHLKLEKKAREKEELLAKQQENSVPAVAESPVPARTSQNNHFTVLGDDKRAIARQFYDATADFEDEEEDRVQEEIIAAPARPLADDDFFSKVPDKEPFVQNNRFDEDAVPASVTDALPEEEPAFSSVEVVSSRPIPEKTADSAPFVPIDVSADEEPENETSEDVADDSKAEKKENDLIINEVHTVKRVGIESFADEADKYYQEKGSDTFFYSFPPLSLLHEDDAVNRGESDEIIRDKEKKLMDTLESFGVEARISCVSRGPRLTRYELVPKPGVKIRSIENLVNEIAMNLEAISVRIEAPIPGKAALGIEVPNIKYSTVRLRGLLDTDTFRDSPGKTTVCLGVDVVGTPVFADLDKMPHLLVAGATGMGKSVCINAILVSLLYKARPDEVKLILIDPKKVEFKSYYNIPHLLVPVVTEAQKAAGALSWAVNEMERRYDIIERVGVRNIKAYNASLAEHPERERMPQIVIVIDELHDLMLQARDAVEDSIARIAAKARAAGILLIIGTQRPSVNVITGVIKANIPSRIAFHVASQIDSRTILDTVGAEKLLNNGDMLFLSPGMQMMSPKRVQGAFLDDDEVLRVTEYLRNNSSGVRYDESIMADMDRESEKYNKEKKASGDFPMGDSGDGSEDDLLYRAIEIALESNKISTSLLQRKLSVGYGKAAKLIDSMEEMGIVSSLDGRNARELLITMDEYRQMRLRADE